MKMLRNISIAKYTGVIVNILFIVYVLLLQPSILEVSKYIMYDEQQVVWFGVGIWVLLILETWALWTILPQIYQRAERPVGGSTIWLWVGHMLLTTVMVMIGVQAIFGSLENAPVFGAIVLVLNVLKEIGLLLVISGPDKTEKKKAKGNSDTLQRFILVVFLCVAYTITWENIISGGDMFIGLSHIGLAIAEGMAAFIIFAAFYFPAKTAFVIEELSLADTSHEKLYLYLTTILAVVVAMSPIFIK